MAIRLEKCARLRLATAMRKSRGTAILPCPTQKQIRRMAEGMCVASNDCAHAYPGDAQILKGVSLVTFFAPANKVARWPVGTPEALALPE